MLPELLFSVGSSMQDISREDFSLLNGGCDKDNLQLITGNDCPLERIKLGHTPDIEPSVSIKLEEPDIYPWHSTTEIGSNLLRHSDDPLISGAIDDNQNEFNPIKTSLPIQPNGSAASTNTLQNNIRSTTRSPSSTNRNNNNSNTAATTQSTISNLPPATAPTINNKKPSRTRRKGQFKLRFHHQALPQEYLDHYEAAQNNLQKKEAQQIKLANQKAAAMATPSSAAAVIEVNEQAARKHDSVRNWLQKISEYQHESSSSSTPQSSANTLEPPAKLDPLLTMNDCNTNSTPTIPATISTSVNHINPVNNPLLKKQPAMSSSRMVSYNDLPYMGEMTLDNCKPRRGRKPKKADICHLIYKNYGTILPGTPKEMRENNERSQSEAHHHHHHNDVINNTTNKNIITAPDSISPLSNKTIAQTKLLGSLLEKRLTNENNNRKTPLQSSPSISPTPSTPTIALKITEENIKLISGKSEEPLNLCVRDRSETLSVSSEDTESCFLDASSIRTSPLILPSETDTLLAENFKMALPNFQTAMLDEMAFCTTDKLLLPSTTNMDPPQLAATAAGIMLIDQQHHHHHQQNHQHLQQKPSRSRTATPPQPRSAVTPSTTPPPGYVYWPAAGVFIHPMTLYYQKMVDANIPSTSIRLPRLSPVLPAGTTTTTIPSTESLIINTPAVSPSPSSSSISVPSSSSPSISSSPVTNVISVNRHDGTAKILIPKSISQLLKQEILPAPPAQQISSDAASPNSSKSASSSSLNSGVNSGASTSTSTTTISTIVTSTPQKRKRSAIFIPPMPVESSSSHATEVSICKFKFTGGAKPSLQEKKMLSVDSGGNFRYYSGTGDKSMRGYEFFPRESLQQSSLLAGSSAGAFLNTPGEKIDLPPPSQGLSNETLQIPELPSIQTNVNTITTPNSRHNHQHHNYQQHHKLHPSMHLLSTPPSPSTQPSQSPTPPSPQPSVSSQPPSQLLSSIQIPPSSSSASPVTRQHTAANSSSSSGNRNNNSLRHRTGGDHSDRRKRKSRRSLQRENLEKTFKEKGFLIQTQQLESAEGATYCKFRQLRKFTRYLFRSWKDYLPGELQQGQQPDGCVIPTHFVDGIDPSTLMNSQMLKVAATVDGGGGGVGTVQNQSPSPTLLQQQQQQQQQLLHQYPSNFGKGNTNNSILHSQNIIKSSPSPT